MDGLLATWGHDVSGPEVLPRAMSVSVALPQLWTVLMSLAPVTTEGPAPLNSCNAREN